MLPDRLGLALLLNRDFFAKGLIQTLLVTPFFIMPVVTGLIWKNELFSPNFGIITWMAGLIGFDGFNPMAQQPLIMVSTMVAWQWEPLFMLVLLAGLQAIPEEEREAARLDGCNRFMVFRYIELPHLLPTTGWSSCSEPSSYSRSSARSTSARPAARDELDEPAVPDVPGGPCGHAGRRWITLILTLIVLTSLLRIMNAVVKEA